MGCMVSDLMGRPGRPDARSHLRHLPLLLGVAVVTAVLLGGCATPRIGGRAERGAEGRYQLRITATSFKFTPNEVHTAAGAPLVLTVTNAASIGHNVTIETPEGRKLASRDIPSGQTVTMQVTLPQGRYLLYCDKTGHKLAGMEGHITAE